MIYKPRCEYAQVNQKGGALHCAKVNGYCAFQYRCEQTGQWENTPTAAGCKARKPKSQEQQQTVTEEATAPTIEPVSVQTETEAATEVLETAEAANKKTTTNTTVSERSNTENGMEQPENKTARRAGGTKRGRRKKRDNVSADAAQASTDRAIG